MSSPVIQKPFNSYYLQIFGTLVNNVAARIYCFQDGTFAGQINFYPDDANLLEDYLYNPSPDVEGIILNMPMSRFEAVVATLRLEQPLWLWLYIYPTPSPYNQNYGMLHTSAEPVGEEETP